MWDNCYHVLGDETIFGQCWAHFDNTWIQTILGIFPPNRGYFWDQTTVGQLWIHFETALEEFWGHVETLMGQRPVWNHWTAREKHKKDLKNA